MVIGLLVFLLLFWQAKTRTMKRIGAAMAIFLGIGVLFFCVALVGNYLLAKHNLPGQYQQLAELEKELDNLTSTSDLPGNTEDLYSFADEYKKVTLEIDSLKKSIKNHEQSLPSDPGFWRVMKLWIGFDPRVFIK